MNCTLCTRFTALCSWYDVAFEYCTLAELLANSWFETSKQCYLLYNCFLDLLLRAKIVFFKLYSAGTKWFRWCDVAQWCVHTKREVNMRITSLALDYSCEVFRVTRANKNIAWSTMVEITMINALYLLWKSQIHRKAKRRRVWVNRTIQRRMSINCTVRGKKSNRTVLHTRFGTH